MHWWCWQTCHQNRLGWIEAQKQRDSEEFLAQAWNDVTSSQVEPAVKYKIFGVARMTVSLLLCKKEKQGKEGKTYTLQEIMDMFAKDLQAAPPHPAGTGSQQHHHTQGGKTNQHQWG